MFKLCPPAFIYLVFSAIQVIIDTFKGLYNTAFFKCIIMFMVTILLDSLCKTNLTIISWIIIFVPFMFMSIIVTMLLYVFGLDVARGTFDYVSNNEKENEKETTKNTNITAVSVPPYYSSSPEYNS